jgi:hypothetical protein
MRAMVCLDGGSWRSTSRSEFKENLTNGQFSPAVKIAVLAILDLISKSEYPQDLKGPEKSPAFRVWSGSGNRQMSCFPTTAHSFIGNRIGALAPMPVCTIE